jgi:hypothetical protein
MQVGPFCKKALPAPLPENSQSLGPWLLSHFSPRIIEQHVRGKFEEFSDSFEI